MKRCFCIGHRRVPATVYPQLEAAIEQHIVEFGVTEFIVGHYGEFDRLVARALAAAKQKHPHITLTLLLPYHPSVRTVDLPAQFDGSFYPDGMERVPPRLAIVRANRYAIEHAQYLIAYAWEPASNARNFVEYARKKRVQITELT